MSAMEEDVLSALVNLGYQRPAAEKALAKYCKNVSGENEKSGSRSTAMFRERPGRLSRNSVARCDVVSLSNAESAEDQVQDVVCGGSAGDGVERTQRAVKIEQQHFVRNFFRDRVLRGLERGE